MQSAAYTLALAVLCMALATPAAYSEDALTFAHIDAAEFESVLAPDDNERTVKLQAFQITTTPVTNAQFLAFVKANPAWQRGAVASVFADQSYLQDWKSATDLGSLDPGWPVTHVSWFAARAYCSSRDARLPTWYEWEWTAAADASRQDARDDPAWRQQMLNWYARTGDTLAAVGSGQPNIHGVYDIHALVWEWVEDFGGMIVSGDNREQGDPDRLKFCGSGALTMERREDYAVLMRIAMLSSLQARYTTANVGFRCARSSDDE